MRTSQGVQDAWDEKVWQHPTVQAMTDRIFPHDVSIDGESDATALRYDPENRVSFITYVIDMQPTPLLGGLIGYRFTVEVAVHLQQAEQPESVFNAVRDRREAIMALVESELGPTWQDTIDYHEEPKVGRIAPAVIDGLKCWKGTVTYTAHLRTTN